MPILITINFYQIYSKSIKLIAHFDTEINNN